MRRIAIVLALVGLALPLAPAAGSVPVGPVEVPQDACQPDPTVLARQTLRCRYGPLQVTPGTNLIMFGPVSVESPKADGYIVRTRPDMVDAVTGEVPPIHMLHLHHGVWLNPIRNQLTPFMAAGEEKTVADFPPGYGYRTSPADQWVLNYMIHNQTGATSTVFITYELDFVPMTAPEAASIKPVEPLWFDVVGGVYPVYNPQQTNVTDPITGRQIHTRIETWGSRSKNYELVWMAGHVHPGGLRDEVRFEECGVTPVFNSEARLNPRPDFDEAKSFGSWDFLMTATPPGWKYLLARDEQVSVTTVYDTSYPWYEAMGIVFGWGHPLSDAEFAAAEQAAPNSCATTSGVETREMPPQEPVFGGEGPPIWDPTSIPATGAPVNRIDIAAFTYKPGHMGEAPAVVTANRPVTFRNLDAAAGIYHTVTQCADLCNLEWGQSYPKPAWGFDSRQLGYGIPEATAASNQVAWDFLPSEAMVNKLVPYFCRVHPVMRGYLKVVPAS